MRGSFKFFNRGYFNSNFIQTAGLSSEVKVIFFCCGRRQSAQSGNRKRSPSLTFPTGITVGAAAAKTKVSIEFSQISNDQQHREKKSYLFFHLVCNGEVKTGKFPGDSVPAGRQNCFMKAKFIENKS